jgi:hypothetical protein
LHVACWPDYRANSEFGFPEGLHSPTLGFYHIIFILVVLVGFLKKGIEMNALNNVIDFKNIVCPCIDVLTMFIGCI